MHIHSLQPSLWNKAFHVHPTAKASDCIRESKRLSTSCDQLLPSTGQVLLELLGAMGQL